jgi:uncharacterized OB-fold protein
MIGIPRPVPVADHVSDRFFQALADGRFTVQHCRACGQRQLKQVLCFACQSPDLEWVTASGRGMVHSFVYVHIGYHPAFAEELPYNVAVVELEEGPQFYASILHCPRDELAIGLKVRLHPIEAEPGQFLPAFEPDV